MGLVVVSIIKRGEARYVEWSKRRTGPASSGRKTAIEVSELHNERMADRKEIVLHFFLLVILVN